MITLVPEAIEEYVAAHTTPADTLFGELAERTQSDTSAPGMMSGLTVGRFLSFMIAVTGESGSSRWGRSPGTALS